MEKEKLEKLLNALADAQAETPDPALAENIKAQIPHDLARHKPGRDSVNIIIDLRVSKLAAAAVITIAMILCANFFGGRNWRSDNLLQNGKLLAKYLFNGRIDGVAEMPRARYEYLREQGIDVVYYGEAVDLADSNAVLIHWQLPTGKYKVIFVDLRTKTISAEDLVRLQTRMLQNKKRR